MNTDTAAGGTHLLRFSLLLTFPFLLHSLSQSTHTQLHTQTRRRLQWLPLHLWRHPKSTQRAPYCLECRESPIHILEQEPEIQWTRDKLSMRDIKTCHLWPRGNPTTRFTARHPEHRCSCWSTSTHVPGNARIGKRTHRDTKHYPIAPGGQDVKHGYSLAGRTHDTDASTVF